MQIGVLGAVTAHRTDDGRAELAPAGPRLRGLLARLALDAGHPVGTSALVEALWGGQPPDGVGNALQSLVSRLRRALGADLVLTAPGGYRLTVAPDDVDALRFATLRRVAADEPDPRRACELLHDALDLWRGPALADVRDIPFAEPAAARLAGIRAEAVEQLAARGHDAGEPGAGLDALTALLEEQPLRESTAVALAWGLLVGGRQADALDVLDRTRDALAESLGMDPGPELARTRMAVLRGEYEVPRTRSSAAGANGHRTASVPPASPAVGSPAAGPPAARDPSAAGSRSAAGRNGSGPSAPHSAGTPSHGGTPPRRAPALTTFVGRDADVARVRELLTGSRLVTVIGPGGAGKTRLSAEVVGPLEGGVVVAELAPLTGDDQLPSALLHAVGGPELVLRGGPDPVDTTERLRAALAGRDLLLVLDNCEHLVGAVAALAQTLLGATAGLRVLATSREPLGITGEVLHPLGALSAQDAARLFTDRAAAVRPGFDGAADAGVVDEICRRLDGQPLPIELAAARVAALSPREIAARLDDRFRLLTTGSRTALPRHQTLRAVVDWSWDLLTVDERRLAARMGVFAGPVDAEAVERVCGGDDPDDAFDLLAVLVDKSLALAAPDPGGGPTRYLMLETIREYAAARLGESGERETITAAHARWAVALVERTEPVLRTRGQLDAQAVFRRAEGEIALALRRAVAAGDGELAHRLLAGVSWSWMIRGSLSSAERWSDEVWALPDPGPGPAAAVNRVFRALLRATRGDSGGASADVDELTAMQTVLPPPWHPALALAEPVRRAFTGVDLEGLAELVEGAEDRWLQGAAAQMLATVAENEGDLDDQRRMLRIAHARFTESGDRFGLGMSVFSLGELEDLAGETDAARAAFTEAVDLATELGNLDDAPQFRMRLAGLAVRTGDIDEARTRMREAQADAEGRDGSWFAYLDAARADIERRGGDTALARTLLDAAVTDRPFGPGPGAPQRDASVLMILAAIELDDGRLDVARDLLDRAAVPAQVSGDGPVVARVAETSARWAVAAGDPERAGELLGVAITRRGTLDHGDPEVVAVLAAVRAALGEERVDAVMARGRSLPRDHLPGPSPVGT